MTDIASAASGIGSIASAFGAGGSSGGGGMVVGGPSPGASYLAGSFQANAAQAAADAAKSAVGDAIRSINQNYQQARYDVQPYRAAGVQALDQLNQYLGLDAYNPGNAPKAPVSPTLDSLAADIKNSEVRNYILQNSSVIGGPNNLGVSYGGVGAVNNNPNAPGYVYWPGGPGGPKGQPSFSPLVNDLMNQSNVTGAIRQNLAQDLLPDALKDYDVAKTGYDRNLQEWQQNLDWYNKYQAEGPLTSQQITENISNQPGYQSELNQGVEAINRSAAARGAVGSGRIMKELTSFGQGTLSKYYNNTLDRLSQIASQGAQAAGQTSQMANQTGQAIGSAQIGLGDTIANSRLASGNAIAQGVLAANPSYKVIGGSGGSK